MDFCIFLGLAINAINITGNIFILIPFSITYLIFGKKVLKHIKQIIWFRFDLTINKKVILRLRLLCCKFTTTIMAIIVD